jgi:hypothetical protein
MPAENDNSYTPVAYEYREVIQELIEKKVSGKIFFWSFEQTIEEVVGQAVKLEELPGKGIFVRLDSGMEVRIDRIITIFGKPGAGFDAYDSFANQCLSCTAGVPL